MTRHKLLLDCDPGHDDAVALLFAHRRFELVGITTVHGNSTLENTTRNALALCTLAGIDVPVARGHAAPLATAAHQASEIHGKSGLDGATLPIAYRAPIEAHAVDFIIETARRHQGNLIVALVGPQTNLAAALQREPRLKAWIHEIAIMGGSTTLGNITPAAEFNVYCDPEAAAIVFASGIPIRMMGYNVTRQTGFNRADVDRLRASGRRVAGTIADLMDFYLSRQQRVYGLDVAPMHDVCALVPYIAPELVTYVDSSVQIELQGTHTRGMTVCDLRGVRPGSTEQIRAPANSNAKVAIAARERTLIELVLEGLLEYS